MIISSPSKIGMPIDSKKEDKFNAGKKDILGSFSLPDSASQGWEGRWSQLVQLRKMVFQFSVD